MSLKESFERNVQQMMCWQSPLIWRPSSTKSHNSLLSTTKRTAQRSEGQTIPMSFSHGSCVSCCNHDLTVMFVYLQTMSNLPRRLSFPSLVYLSYFVIRLRTHAAAFPGILYVA